MITLEAFMRLVSWYSRNHSEFRYGQSVFVIAYTINPLASDYAGGTEDPFYNDDKVSAFIDKLIADGTIIS